MKFILPLLFALLSLLPASAFAERSRAALSTSRAPRPTGVAPQWRLLFESRPSLQTSTNKYYGDNFVEVGVKVKSDISLGYQQQFSNNYYNNNPALEDGPQLALSDGFLFSRVDSLWKGGSSSLSLEPRLYLPTADTAREHGMVSRLRTHLIFQQTVSPYYSLYLIEAPIFHVFDRAGIATANGLEANQYFENRFYVVHEFNLSRSVTLGLPLMLKSVRYSDFSDLATNNNRWSHAVTFNPELTLKLSTFVSVGAAFETASLVSDDFSSTSVSEGFSQAIYQFVFRLSF